VKCPAAYLQQFHWNQDITATVDAGYFYVWHHPQNRKYITQHIGWRFSAVVASFVARTKMLNIEPVSTGIGYRLRAGIPPRYVTKPTRSTQPCIPLGSLNRVPALIGWGKGGNVTSAGWQITLCDPIWHVSSRSGVVLVAQTAIHFFIATPP